MEIELRKDEDRRTQWEELERQRKTEEQRRAKELRRRKELLQQVAGLDKAESIQRLVEALVRRFVANGGAMKKFEHRQAWAFEVAAALDPTDSLFELLRVPSGDPSCLSRRGINQSNFYAALPEWVCPN